MKNKIIKSNKGFTMVELLLVLGLVSLMTLGIYSQLGKNENYSTLISGDELLSLACLEVEKAQSIVGGKVVYLECEDTPKLKDFYERNGFVIFGKRELDCDEVSKFTQTYLIQMLKYLSTNKN